jgi:exoribonuclease R
MLITKNYRDFEVSGGRVFHGAKFANRCLPNDEVEETETGCTLVRRAEHPLLAGLMELNSKVRYGFTARNIPIYLFTPFNESYPPFIVGCSERDKSKNRLAIVKFDAWTETYPRGLLQQLLQSEEEALFWTYTPFACVKYKGSFPEPAALTKRPLEGLTFHIDPPGCRDVDDVLSIHELADECYITITIADVASVVQEGSPLDLRARKIAQTFYQEGVQPKHMLPPELSEEALSLLPGAPKPGLSLRFPLSNPATTEWFESTVETTHTYTYESVYSNGKICDILRRMSTALGQSTDDSHEWIEVAMKFYNTEAAKLIQKAKTGLLRSHSPPDAAKLEIYTRVDPMLKFLAYSSATYVPATDPNPVHWGLSTSVYCHASSPIRRYADLVNQRVIKALLNQAPLPQPVDPKNMNRVAKEAKRHDRDLFFIQALKKERTGQIAGKILTIKPVDENLKISVYVPDWRLVIKLTYKSGSEPDTVVSKDEQTVKTIGVGQSVIVQYHADFTARKWKKRMVFRLQ